MLFLGLKIQLGYKGPGPCWHTIRSYNPIALYSSRMIRPETKLMFGKKILLVKILVYLIIQNPFHKFAHYWKNWNWPIVVQQRPLTFLKQWDYFCSFPFGGKLLGINWHVKNRSERWCNNICTLEQVWRISDMHDDSLIASHAGCMFVYAKTQGTIIL